MIKENLHFVKDGETSRSYGIMNVTLDSGLYEEIFVAPKTIVEEKISGRTKPYFQGVERDPIEFDLTLYFENGFTDKDLQEAKRWLDNNQYDEFYFENNPSRRYLLMMHDSSELLHNGNGEGYITTSWRANDAYAISQEYLDNVIDLSANPIEGTMIQFDNKSDIEMTPECWIEKVGAGDVTITNNSNNGEVFEFVGLADGETVYVDNYNENIVSDIPGIYRYENFNSGYLEFVRGINSLKCEGTFKLQFRYRYLFK